VVSFRVPRPPPPLSRVFLLPDGMCLLSRATLRTLLLTCALTFLSDPPPCGHSLCGDCTRLVPCLRRAARAARGLPLDLSPAAVTRAE
jgi:hypothetical protein